MNINFIQDLKHTNKIEELKKKLCLGLIDNLGQPTDKESEYLLSMISGEHNSLPIPSNRTETLMYFSLIGGNIDLLEKPNSSWSRKEKYWYAIATGFKNDVIEPGEGCSKEDILDYWLALYSAVREWLEVSGTKIVIPNSRQGFSKELGIRGRTLQNLVDRSLYTNIQNSTFKDNGFITTTITNNPSPSLNFCWLPANKTLAKANTTHTIIVDVLENNFNMTLCINEGNASSSNSCWDTNITLPANFVGRQVIKAKTITDITSTKQLLRPYFYSSSNGYSGTITMRIMIFEGDIATEQLPSNYIEGIESVGSKEGNKVSIQSRCKNLFDINFWGNQQRPGFTSRVDGNRFYVTLKNQYYSETVNIYNTNIFKNGRTYIGQGVYSDNWGYSSILFYKNALLVKEWHNIKSPLTINFEYDNITMRIVRNGSTTVIGEFWAENIQIEEGTVATEYQSYQTPQLTEWQLTEPLRSLPNGVCDEVDKTGLETRRVGKVVLNSNNPNVRVDGFNSSFSQDINLINYFISDGKNKNGTSQDYVVDKTILVSTSDRNINNIDKICTFIDNANRGALIQYILPKSITTIEQAKTYIDSKNVTVLYELATPTTNQLTKQNIATFNDYTNITCTNNVKGYINALIPSKKLF